MTNILCGALSGSGFSCDRITQFHPTRQRDEKHLIKGVAHSLSSQNMKEYNENAFLERNREKKLMNVGPRGPWSSVSGKLNLGLSGCTCRLPPLGTNAMQIPNFGKNKNSFNFYQTLVQ